MTPKIRQTLDQIQEVLLLKDQDARDLWAILTALRGPDIPDDSIGKWHTTSIVRHQAFPKLYESDFGMIIGATINDKGTLHQAAVYADDYRSELGNYFVQHIKRAVNGLER